MLDVGVSADFGRKLAVRSVWTRVRPHGSGVVYWARVLFLSRVLARVWLNTSASTIVCTLRARWRRAMETLFQALRMSRYSFISWDGRRQFVASSRSGFVFAYALA